MPYLALNPLRRLVYKLNSELIMWHAISKHISEQLNIPFVITHKEQLNLSSNSLTFTIGDGTHQFFVKVDVPQKLEQFEAEAYNLKELTLHSALFVPDCICYGLTLNHSFIVLEWLPLTNQADNNWFEMGKLIALMHKKHEQAMYGWPDDNFLGQTIQTNRWHKHWDIFFAEQRIGWQLQLLAEKEFHFCEIDAFIELTKASLHSHVVQPSLLHGDLWRGNVGFVDGTPALFDPACYFGDREVDIAMTQLFGEFPAAFYQGYQDHYPLSASYEQRKPFYQLYHILQHANAFQGHYLIEAKEKIADILHTAAR